MVVFKFHYITVFAMLKSFLVFFIAQNTSGTVLEARPWPGGALRPNFVALALASAPVALALASKV